jgi:nitrite reductase/ring-hydroxylating ferredoxin subunit
MSADRTKPGLAERLEFGGLLLTGVILVIATCIAIGAVLYLLPGTTLEAPGNQPELRIVEESEFPVGSSRVESWGGAVILVIRPEEGRYVALQGTSPGEGCILNWDEASRRVVSPCRTLVYDLQGNVVSGLTRQPLRRYSVFVRRGVVFVVDPSVAERG